MKPQAHSVTQRFILKMKWSIAWIMQWRQCQLLIHNYYLPHWLRPSQHFSYPQDICALSVHPLLLSVWILTGFEMSGKALRALLQSTGSVDTWECPPSTSAVSQVWLHSLPTALADPAASLCGDAALPPPWLAAWGAELVPSGTPRKWSCPHQFCTRYNPYPE